MLARAHASAGKYAPDDRATNSPVIVGAALTSGQIQGSGTINNASVADAREYLKGSSDEPAEFYLRVQCTKSGGNPQGEVQILDRSYYKTDGTLDSLLHTYMFKSTALPAVKIALGNSTVPSKAQLSTKADVVEILSDGSATSIDANADMTLTLTDNGTLSNKTGPNTLAVIVKRSDGQIWYSAGLSGRGAVEKPMASGTSSIQ
jgi:hypothetical protein